MQTKLKSLETPQINPTLDSGYIIKTPFSHQALTLAVTLILFVSNSKSS
jgi:hypothetical protein